MATGGHRTPTAVAARAHGCMQRLHASTAACAHNCTAPATTRGLNTNASFTRSQRARPIPSMSRLLAYSAPCPQLHAPANDTRTANASFTRPRDKHAPLRHGRHTKHKMTFYATPILEVVVVKRTPLRFDMAIAWKALLSCSLSRCFWMLTTSAPKKEETTRKAMMMVRKVS